MVHNYGNPIPLRPAILKGVDMDVCQALKDADLLDCIESFYRQITALGCFVTCARDLTGHSAKSAHGKGWALDLRTKHLYPGQGAKRWGKVSDFAAGLAKSLNLGHAEMAKERGYLYVVLEPSELLPSGKQKTEHIHLEWAPFGYPPNIKGYKPLEFFYIKNPG